MHTPLPIVVGIGASAGGVEALRGFFTAAEPGCNLAFIVYLHFPAHSPSHLVSILGQCTALPVTMAVHGEAVQPDHVYVAPPGTLATLSDGHLNLGEVGHNHNPIDVLFCSLASAYGEHAIGVVLSGTGSDGTHGIQAISAAGGLTVAQRTSGETSSHPEMPASAIATGRIDHVLPVEEIPPHLAAYGKGLSPEMPGSSVEHAPHHLKGVKDALCELLQNTVRHDFSRYKASTFLRRVGRRMRVLNISDWSAYVEHARATPDEVLRLFHDLLIGVTAFFRDEDAFQALAKDIIPRLFKGKGSQDKVRVWVAGCSSGEEAYSIAILLCEHAKTLPSPPQMQVFATDVDEDALRVARLGCYPASLLEGVRADRVTRFFIREGAQYRASKQLRAICTFAAHSIIRDPPLCSIDLISCRNVMIYFDRYLQDQVIPTFHFALAPGGFLFLGPSENIGRHDDLFTSVDNAHRLFERVGGIRRSIPFLPPSTKGKAAARDAVPVGWKSETVRTIAQSADAQILKHYGPANVVVNERGDIVHFSSRTGKYLEPSPGIPNPNLLFMARTGLRIGLRSALHESKKSGKIAVRDNCAITLDGKNKQTVRVTVEPLNHKGEGELWLVTFMDIGDVLAAEEPGAEDIDSTATEMAVQQLEREVQDTRESLQSAIDEYEIAVEELRSSNEELMSMNDDLQASNEELEASKEELHVINGELQSVNADLVSKIEELKQANGDLRNLFESTKIAVIFLDGHLVIRSFTRAVTEMFRLVPADCGRHLSDIVSFLDYDTLDADIAIAMNSRETVQRPIVRRDGGAHYLVRVIPYLTLDGRVDGVLITLTNVTAAVDARAQDQYHRLLISELNHRVKNILTVAASLATQSLRCTSTPEEFAKVFLGRLQALAKAHDVLATENWGDVPLKALIAAGLELQVEDKERLTLDGPPIRINAKAATTLSLAVHELATNATKYGAFANGSGHVYISWAQELRPQGTFLVIRWRESGGPPVLPPTRKGFGSELIERGIKYELRGSAKLDYLPAGLEVQIAIPLDGPCLPDPAPTNGETPHELSE